MALVRWTFQDTETLEEYEFQMNPNQGGSPSRTKNFTQRQTAAHGGSVLVFEGQRELMQGQASGIILEEQHYIDLALDWFERSVPLILTDDLGRQYRILLTGFNPTRGWKVHHPWRHEYTLDWLVLQEIA